MVVEGGRFACFNRLIDVFIRVLESVHVLGLAAISVERSD